MDDQLGAGSEEREDIPSMASMPEGDMLGASADHLVFSRLRVILAYIRPPPGIEHVRMRVDLLVMVDRVHRDRDLRTLGDKCAVREGVVLHRGTPQGLCKEAACQCLVRARGQARRRTGAQSAVALGLAEEAVDLVQLVHRVLRPALRFGHLLYLVAQGLEPLGVCRKVEHGVRERLWCRADQVQN